MSDNDVRVEYMRLNDYTARFNEANPKDHDIGYLEGLMNRFGFVEVPIIDERSGQVVSGHGRGETLKEKMDSGESPPARIKVDEDGMWMLPVVRGISFNSDAEKDAYTVAANHSTERGGWIAEKLAELASSIDDPELRELAGFNDETLANLIASADEFGEDIDLSEFEGVTDTEIKYKVVIEGLDLDAAHALAESLSYPASVVQYRVTVDDGMGEVHDDQA